MNTLSQAELRLEIGHDDPLYGAAVAHVLNDARALDPLFLAGRMMIPVLRATRLLFRMELEGFVDAGTVRHELFQPA